jgi:hypothetical protein
MALMVQETYEESGAKGAILHIHANEYRNMSCCLGQQISEEVYADENDVDPGVEPVQHQ